MASRFWPKCGLISRVELLPVAEVIGDRAPLVVAARAEAESSHCQAAGFGVDLHIAERTRHPARYRHAIGTTVILSGQSGADAHHYQEKDVRRAIAATKESKP